MRKATSLILLLPLIIACSKEKSLESRIKDRDYPSIFLAWSMADNLGTEDKESGIARHDMYMTGSKALKIFFEGEFEGLATFLKQGSVEEALAYKKLLLELNPNIITLAEVRYRDAREDFLPSDSPFWMRDADGNKVYGWEEGKFIRLEMRDTVYQNIVAQKSASIINSGAVDGIFLDWWSEDEFLEERLAILEAVREAIGEDALIFLNSNERIIPKSAPYANGIFMECWDSFEPTAELWQTYQTTLEWAEEYMREPRINCLEIYTNNRDAFNEMRAATTLSLCVSDGYVLFADNGKLPTPDHKHDWYDFYNSSLGIPVAKDFKRDDGAQERLFTKGSVIYNPLGNSPVSISFKKLHTSMSSGITDFLHEVSAFDGDIFICKEE